MILAKCAFVASIVSGMVWGYYYLLWILVYRSKGLKDEENVWLFRRHNLSLLLFSVCVGLMLLGLSYWFPTASDQFFAALFVFLIGMALGMWNEGHRWHLDIDDEKFDPGKIVSSLLIVLGAIILFFGVIRAVNDFIIGICR